MLIPGRSRNENCSWFNAWEWLSARSPRSVSSIGPWIISPASALALLLTVSLVLTAEPTSILPWSGVQWVLVVTSQTKLAIPLCFISSSSVPFYPFPSIIWPADTPSHCGEGFIFPCSSVGSITCPLRPEWITEAGQLLDSPLAGSFGSVCIAGGVSITLCWVLPWTRQWELLVSWFSWQFSLLEPATISNGGEQRFTRCVYPLWRSITYTNY